MSHRAAAAEAFPDSAARVRAILASASLPPALRPALASLDWAMLLPNRAAPGFFY
ncbi:MAG: hypothetical protein H0T41_06425, partial [Rhodobacteraceae bacterium]|nr:hypothetical protein [Paracoccaceae bacterium]